ncbi:LOW QUALITY PROTEIN: uncharacterized protein QC763_503895 [Podospora pseudopauciseta]|uniref:Uncharacterized protein n=1 Tax=Podospora pseudopauciseta TaxID=2093780 RepID=A0ABR0H869_9PEZI|nr:LOW QUALITY PROTEIN: hypothetical protein QC763_503895 [Podospora pseudopauciseta]
MRFQHQVVPLVATAAGWLGRVEGSPIGSQNGIATVALPETSPVGYGILRYASPDLRRSLLGEEGGVPGGLSKRQCAGQLICTAWINVCCPLGTTCCSATSCCLAGYGCYSGYCLKDTVTVWTTRYSTYTDYETSYSTYVSLKYDYTTVTVRSKNGVATSTEWTTVTREAAKRRQLIAPTPTSTHDVGHTPSPTKPPRLEDLGAGTMESSPNHLGLVRRVLERAGVVEKRASTAWITVWPTWTTTFWYYRTSWYYSYVTSVRYSTITSTQIIFDGASSTTTVRSTTTVFTQKPPPAQTPPPNNPPAADPPPANNTPAPPPADEPAPTKPPETVTLTQSPPDNGGAGGGGGGDDTNNTPPPAPDTTPVSSSSHHQTSSSPLTLFIIATTETPSPAPPASGTLPQGTVIGIGVGSALGGIALIAALVFFFLRYRRKNPPPSTDDSTVGRNSQTAAISGGRAGGGAGGGAHDSTLYGVFGRKEIDSRSPSVIVSSPVAGSPSPGNLTGAGTVSSMSPPPPERQQRGGSYVSELEQNAGRRTPGMGELHETTRGSELYDTGYGGYGWKPPQELPARRFSPGLQEMPEEPGHYAGMGQDRPVPYRQYDGAVVPDLSVGPTPQMRGVRGEDPYGLGDVPYPSAELLARGYGAGPGGGQGQRQGQGQGWGEGDGME